MKRLTAPLVLLGIALVGAAVWLYTSAANDRDTRRTICQLGGADCVASMSWTPVALVAVGALGAFAAAWWLGRSVEAE